MPPLNCCRRAIATALLPHCPPPPPCHCRAIATALLSRCPPLPPCCCRAIVATLLLCCRCRAATDGCREAAAVAVLSPRCCHHHLHFYCRCRCHCCRAIVLPLLDAVTALLPPPCCPAAYRCLPTPTLPVATAPPPRCHCRCRAAATVADRHHCRATAAVAVLLPPPPHCRHLRRCAANTTSHRSHRRPHRHLHFFVIVSATNNATLPPCFW